MKKSKIVKIFTVVIITAILFGFVIKNVKNKASFIEYDTIGQDCNVILDMISNDYTIEQEIKVPNELLYGVAFSIGNYGRENNSRYEVTIKDKELDQVIAVKEFNSTSVIDSLKFDIKFTEPIKVDVTHTYIVEIKAKTPVNSENGIAFYADENVQNDCILKYNSNEYNADLCMNIYSGQSTDFWIIFTILCEICIASLIIYAIDLNIKGKSIIKNPIIQAGMLSAIILILLSAFANVKTFCDEIDNMLGGFLMNRGYTLYVDYNSQHTPVSYFMCAVFNLFHAVSVKEFRILYYFCVAIAYGLIYIRYNKHFGKLNLVLLPLIQLSFSYLVGNEAIMILSDNIQAIALTTLFLEFLMYLQDEKLDWRRSIIIALCIAFSFGVAFVSAYGISAIVLAVLIKEILYWKKNGKISFMNLIKRYIKLAITCTLLLIIALTYVILTHSLSEMYEQAFAFNREVYPVYLKNGLGSNVFQPFLLGISNFLQIIPNAINNIVLGEDIVLEIAKILLGIYIITVIVKMLKQKEYLKAFASIIFICFNFTRTNEAFHEIPAWFAMILISIINTKFDTELKDSSKLIFTIFMIISFGTFLGSITEYAFIQDEVISDVEKEVIDNTVEGEKIFYDIYSYPSMYFAYKNRLPMNVLVFVLPWSLDWYELDIVNELIQEKPRVVVYDEDLKAWEISGYDCYFKKTIHENYNQLETTTKVWKIK